METSEYLPMFLAEGREHLQELNLAVVRIEEQPDDRETVDEIFRIAHSMKGMSATMGFSGMAALTHEMEDVFELLKQRSGGLPRVAIDVLLECLDTLEASVEAIDATGAESIAPAPLIQRLRGLVRADEDSIHAAQAASAAAQPDPALLAERAGSRRLVDVTVTLDADCLMPGVRAYMVIAAAGDHGDVVGSTPDAGAVEGFAGHVIELYVATDREDAALAATLAKLPDVSGVDVREHAVAVEAPAPATGEPARPAPAEAEAEGPPKQKHASTVRVDAERLDQLMHVIGELVLHRTQVEALVSQADVPGLSQAMQNLTRASHALQAMVMQVRMIPVEAVFLRFPRLVRDLSQKLGKSVELKLVGKDTDMDRTVVEMLGDPLVHLVRNSLDHGLESVADREAAGKPPTGTLEIAAHHAGGNVVITVHDDGRGIDPRKVAEKAAGKGLIPAEAIDSIDVAKAVELLFLPGFSTAETTSDISGRGVGMDAVRNAIRELGGEVIMTSEPGSGTTAEIRLPLTLAIINALLVEADGQPLALPIERVERTVKLADHLVRYVAGRRMLLTDDGVLPILDAGERFSNRVGGEAAHAVVLRGRERRLALAVSSLVGQRELVTRPLPAAVTEGSALSGGAVLSDGSIALIIDCDALFGAKPGVVPVAA